jgi:hypothetical protein
MDEPLANLLFKYPGADIILRSHDSHHFLVPKSFIVNNSPILDELIRKALGPLTDIQEPASLPVVELPESGATLHSLLTFLFPVTPLVPSTTENAMELLSVAQRYQMDSVLAHIRLSISRQSPPSTQRGAALHMYSLAQRYGLRQEALQAARAILKYPMNIEDLEDKLDGMPGASLYELWKYFEEVRSFLASDIKEFRTSGARGTLTGLHCADSGSSQIPRWLDDYIASIGDTPHLFDLIEFNIALARHMRENGRYQDCACMSISSQTMRSFWEALASVVDSSFEAVSIIGVYELLTRLTSSQAGPALSLVREREVPQPPAPAIPTTYIPELFGASDADVIIQSSDLIHFRVHKPVLAIASPVLKDLFSPHQPSNSESADGLPVVQLAEDAELLNILFSMLYPVHLVKPKSYEQVLYLLSVCQKYEMDHIQALIRAEVDRREFPIPVGTEVFRAYAIASSKRLIPEMENMALLALNYPMTFETLGEGIRLFEGSALHELAHFRKRCRDNAVACLQSVQAHTGNSPFKIWIGCTTSYSHSITRTGHSPIWLTDFVQQCLTVLGQAFTKPFPLNIREKYMSALQAHTTSSSGKVTCVTCAVSHVMKGEMFCRELENRLGQTISEVSNSFIFWRTFLNVPSRYTYLH